MKRLIALAALVAASLLSTASHAMDYGITQTGTDSVVFYVDSAEWADVHYILNGEAQQNFRMVAANGRLEWPLDSLNGGDVIQYFFTYYNPPGAVDSPWATYTHGSGGGSSGGSSSSSSSSSSGGGSGGGWTLVWSDEFSGSGQPDPANWNYHVGNGWNPGTGAFDGWGNQELQWYRPENCYQQGGNLVIRGENNPIAVNGQTFDWRSCRITTQGKHSWTYGRIEARISSPSLQGKWNAFWMLGDSQDGSYTSAYTPAASHHDSMATNWASCGEVDIFENVNQDSFTHHHNFWDTRTGVFPYDAGSNADYGSTGAIGNTENFHVYALEWDRNEQRYYVDGVLTHTIDITPGTLEEFHKPMHLILNMALGGRLTYGYDPIPAEWPRETLVDYVRVYKNDGGSGGSGGSGGGAASVYQHCDYDGFNDLVSSIVISTGGDFDPGTPSTGATHPRLTIRNGCPTETMWVHWLTVPGFLGGVLDAPNHTPVPANGSTSYDIPDKGLAAMRFWPSFDCDASGLECRIGASGGPEEFGFSCPPEGCAPPIDSKFEATFGCITGVDEDSCQANPSGGGPLGRSDWWNSSAVDGFTVPMKVDVNGYCPEGPVTSGPFAGPGGPAGGAIDCSALRVSDCPRNADLSTDGLFPQLANMDLLAVNPSTGEAGGCLSPAGKLTYANWGNTPTYTPDAPEAQMYTCPTPPISEPVCRAGPAERSAYRDYIHSVCPTYAYAYDDGFGLSSCPASTLTSYEVTFYCPQ